ncbi:MAG: hypothetical protein KGS48_06230 [Bacteroidetes bacterium]|nr:hypothetical protein [Bacteroidota bacterium]
MTLREFFDYLGQNPALVLAYFLVIPFTALLAGWMGKGEGHVSPWKYLYATLIYLVCVPGIFAATLSVYQYIFERGSIMNTDVLTQILPVGSMVLTLSIIRQQVAFADIPGFDKISTLITTIFAVFVLMYVLDRTHLIVWVNVPVFYFILILVALLVVIRWGARRLVS